MWSGKQVAYISVNTEVVCNTFKMEQSDLTKTSNSIFENIVFKERIAFSNRAKVFTASIGLLIMVINTYLAYKALPILSKYAVDESSKPNMLGASLAIFMVLPASSFLLSLFITLVPYKNLKYSEKYFHFSLIILVILQVLLAFVFCLTFLTKS